MEAANHSRKEGNAVCSELTPNRNGLAASLQNGPDSGSNSFPGVALYGSGAVWELGARWICASKELCDFRKMNPCSVSPSLQQGKIRLFISCSTLICG